MYPAVSDSYNLNSMAFSPQENYTEWVTVAGRRILVPIFADRRMSLDQRGRSSCPSISVL
jgi:hypothetical protein